MGRAPGAPPSKSALDKAILYVVCCIAWCSLCVIILYISYVSCLVYFIFINFLPFFPLTIIKFSYTGRLLAMLGACGSACDILSMTVRMTKLPVTALRTPVTELLVIMRVAGLLVSF